MNLNEIAEDYLKVADQVFGQFPEQVETLSADIAERLKQGNKVMICGNGGSAADAQHMAGEFINRFLKNRKPYAGMALSTDTSSITAIANDFSYEEIFEKQVQALGKAGDVLIGFSTSGGAANVCRAMETAKDMDILTIGLTGGEGGELGKIVDQAFIVSCTKSTPRIQEGHQLLMHLLCQRIEELVDP